MADNYVVKDANNTDRTIRAKDIAGAYSPRIIPQVADADVATGNPLPVAGTVTANLGTIAGAATQATLAELSTKVPALGQAAMAASTPVVIANNQSRVPTSILLAAGVSRQLAVTSTSSNTVLTPGIRAISILARGGTVGTEGDVRFLLGNVAQTATSSSHYIAPGERLDLDVSGLATPNIAVIQGPASVDCTLEVMELN
jgi:hypothetical protein